MTHDGSPVPTIAVDLGGTKISAAVVDGPTLHHRIERDTGGRDGRDAVLARITAIVADVASAAGTLWHLDRAPVAVASTGRVVGGHVHAVNDATMPGWGDVPLQDHLARTTGRSTTVVNDAHAAAWGEYLYGAGHGAHGFAFVTWSTGIGGGLVIDGRPWTGAHGLAGHLGFVREPDGDADADDRHAFVAVERLAGGRALDRRAHGAGAASARDLLAAARDGRPDAVAVVDTAVARVARALAALQLIVDVDVVAIGGGVGLATGVLDRLRTAVRSDPLTPEGIVPTLRPAALGADAGLIGAAAWPRRTS